MGVNFYFLFFELLGKKRIIKKWKDEHSLEFTKEAPKNLDPMLIRNPGIPIINNFPVLLLFVRPSSSLEFPPPLYTFSVKIPTTTAFCCCSATPTRTRTALSSSHQVRYYSLYINLSVYELVIFATRCINLCFSWSACCDL